MANIQGPALALVVMLTGCRPLVKSSDGRVATPTPPGKGWVHNEPEHLSYEDIKTEIKWTHQHEGTHCVLSAFEQVWEPMPLKAFCGQDWQSYCAGFGSKVTAVDAQSFVRAGVPGCRVSCKVLMDEGFGLHELQIRLVFVPHGDRMLRLTAGGDHVVDQPAMVDEWMAGVKFKALGDSF